MTVVELIEALIPYGDAAPVRVTVMIQGKALHYEFTVQPDALGVAFVATMGDEAATICAQIITQIVLNHPLFERRSA